MPSENATKVLQALGSQTGPLSSKQIAEIAGLESSQVSCQIGALKKKGLVHSPLRCKYEITETGRSAIIN